VPGVGVDDLADVLAVLIAFQPVGDGRQVDAAPASAAVPPAACRAPTTRG